MGVKGGGGGARAALVVSLAVVAAAISAQALTINTTAGELRIKAPAFAFIEGAVLDRLRDGRTVRLSLELAVLTRPKGTAIAEDRQSFNLSLDLWEARVAITRVGNTPRSVSHLKPADAEVWCLDNLAVPLTSLGRLGRDAPFWLRLSYKADPDRTAEVSGDSGFTLQGLIDRLSRRSQDGVTGRTIEAGPFRLSN